MFAMCGGALLSLAACSQEPATKAKTDAAPAATEETAAPETPAPAETAAAEPVALEITHNGAQMTGDPAAGERVFAQCRTCHSPEAGQNRTGPSLHGIIGRQAGTVPGFRYSNANRTSGITWTEQELFNYLENPRQRIPGTIMSFVGLRDAQQRADVIAYLKQTTSD
ncbi:MAG: c-type cytochrome [Alphaproteobacteria bacterium]|nr:c-type cytochrome [Alphaproteobacteria bacterium]